MLLAKQGNKLQSTIDPCLFVNPVGMVFHRLQTDE